MMLLSSQSSGLRQRYWLAREGGGTRNSLATCLMFGHSVRAKENTLTFLKIILGITCHEILSFGRRPYRDVRPKLGKGKEALAEFLKNKRTMDTPKRYFPMEFDNDHVEVMFQKIVKKVFLAPSGAQGVTLSVRLFSTSLSKTMNLHLITVIGLSQICHGSVSDLSQVSLGSVSGQSRVSLGSVSGQ